MCVDRLMVRDSRRHSRCLSLEQLPAICCENDHSQMRDREGMLGRWLAGIDGAGQLPKGHMASNAILLIGLALLMAQADNRDTEGKTRERTIDIY